MNDRRGAHGRFDKAAPAAALAGNPYVGSWNGRGSDGYTYRFNFTGAEWDSAIEKKGVAIPLYRGTYTCTNAQAALKATDEINTSTMKWMPVKKPILLTGKLKEALNNLTVSASILPKMVNFSEIGQILAAFLPFSLFFPLFPEKRAQVSSSRPQWPA